MTKRIYKLIMVGPENDTEDSAIETALRIAGLTITASRSTAGIDLIKSEVREHALKGMLPWAGYTVSLLMDIEDLRKNVRSDRAGRPEDWK